MKKALLAAAMGLSLVGGQSLAQASAAPAVGDRLGATAGASDELAGGVPAGLIFAAVAIAGFVILVEAGDDDSESD